MLLFACGASNQQAGNLSSMDMTVKEVLQLARKNLSQYVDDSYTDACVLLAHCLQKDRAWLIAHDDGLLNASQEKAFLHLLDERQHGVPVAYLTGSREFWSRSFRVTSDTLIPRPETEQLIEYVLALSLPSSDIDVLDFGTGSGVIAITLAGEYPAWRVSAIDCSRTALQIARSNAKKYHAEIHFIEGSDLCACEPRSLDLIVSNPPYIEEADPHLRQGDVRFEPLVALASGGDGLDCIRYLIADAPQYLKPAGQLVMEHGYAQASAVRDLLQQRGYQDIVTRKDLAGHARMTSAKWGD